MQNYIKVFSVGVIAAASCFFLTACGDDSSSSAEEEVVSDIFSLSKPFEIVLDKSNYSFDKSDSVLTIAKPVCESRTLGYLVGPDSAPEWDTLSYKVSISKSTVTLRGGDSSDVQKFTYDEAAFPVGFWSYPDYGTEKIQKGRRINKNGLLTTVFSYDGSCFMKDFFGVFREGNAALEEADSVLTRFYNSFKSAGDTALNEKQMLADMRVSTCDEITLYDALVSVKLSEFKASSGKLTVSYDSVSCPVTFQLRYAYDQKDCQAAFDEFENDRNAAKEFDFNNYWKNVEYDEYCIAQLILDLKRKKKIPLKVAAQEVNTAEFASSLVDIFAAGLRK